jgi:hypothetical protein
VSRCTRWYTLGYASDAQFPKHVFGILAENHIAPIDSGVKRPSGCPVGNSDIEGKPLAQDHLFAENADRLRRGNAKTAENALRLSS